MDFIYHQKGTDARSGQALARYALETNRRCLLFSNLSEIPEGFDGLISGSVETIQKALHRHFRPDYFPEFTKDFIGRKVFSALNDLYLPSEPCFLKPLDSYKRFDAFRYDGKLENLHADAEPPFQVQSIIEVISECRYYVTNGKVITKGWYSPHDFAEEIESPPLPAGMRIPKTWSGTIDVGSTADCPSLVIECHHPFSCGWYGESEDFMLFGKWLEDGWKYLKSM